VKWLGHGLLDKGITDFDFLRTKVQHGPQAPVQEALWWFRLFDLGAQKTSAVHSSYSPAGGFGGAAALGPAFGLDGQKARLLRALVQPWV